MDDVKQIMLSKRLDPCYTEKLSDVACGSLDATSALYCSLEATLSKCLRNLLQYRSGNAMHDGRRFKAPREGTRGTEQREAVHR